MNRVRAIYVTAVFVILAITGCTSDGNLLTAPASVPDALPQLSGLTSSSTQAHLWGFYDVYFDIGNQNIDAVVNRDVMFSANVVTFLNQNPANIEFVVNDTPLGDGYVDADFDVSLTHPLPGMPEYNGYDVRGIFIGDGSCIVGYNPDLKYSNDNSEQVHQNADGYTRWFNPAEFTGAFVLGYTNGVYATPGYKGSATLNSYMYFADGLGATDDLFTWLNDNPGTNGVFNSGSKNTRNYYIRFPIPDPNVKFGYAVLASWEGEDEVDHPANTPETVACNIVNNSVLSYTAPNTIEGTISLDFSLLGWHGQPSTITLDAGYLNAPYELTSEMVPTGGNEMYSTYHVELGPLELHAAGSDDIWIIAEYPDYDYTNEYGIDNAAGTDKLAAYFRCLVEIENPYGPTPGWAVDFSGDTGWDVAVDYAGNVIVSGESNYLGKYSPSGDLLWEKNTLGAYYAYRICVDVDSQGNIYVCDSENGGFLSKYSPDGELIWELPTYSEDSSLYFYGFTRALTVDAYDNVYIAGQNVYYDLGDGSEPFDDSVYVFSFDSDGAFRWGKAWGDWQYAQGHSVAVDDTTGNVYVSGRYSAYNWDPGDGSSVSTKGDRDVFITAFDSTGTVIWARAFGGELWDESRGVAAHNGKVFVMGSFNSPDFDPGDGSSVASMGWLDLFVTAFDDSGNFLWTKIWGGGHDDRSWGIETSIQGTLSVSGFFESNNFDPGNGSSIASHGDRDVFISTFDINGNFLWAHTFGGNYEDWGVGVDFDPSGNVYTTGQFSSSVDFAPTNAPCYESPDVHSSGNGYVIKYLDNGCW